MRSTVVMLHLQDRLPVLRASLNRQQFEALNNSWRSNLTANKLDRIIRDLVRAFKPFCRPRIPHIAPLTSALIRPRATCLQISTCGIVSKAYRGLSCARAYYAYSTNSLNDVNLIIRARLWLEPDPLARITLAKCSKAMSSARTDLTVSERNLSLSQSSLSQILETHLYRALNKGKCITLATSKNNSVNLMSRKINYLFISTCCIRVIR